MWLIESTALALHTGYHSLPGDEVSVENPILRHC
jgi:hypothetical protein